MFCKCKDKCEKCKKPILDTRGAIPGIAHTVLLITSSTFLIYAILALQKYLAS